MPELPEVETVRRGLERLLTGRRLVHVEQRRRDLRVPFPPRFVERLTGQRVVGLRRRAKYLLVDLDGGEVLVAHLGMSGRMVVADGPPGPPSPHDHVVFETDAGQRVVFNDARRFGMMTLLAAHEEATHPLFAALGPEPLDPAFDGAMLAGRLAGKMTPIKAALLDQRVVAGIGNIYACEALFRARIAPRRMAATVVGQRAHRLADAVKGVIAEAIEAGGSSLRDYVQADGELGYFQHRWAVYEHEGDPCQACTTKLRRVVQSGRSSFYCPRCQR